MELVVNTNAGISNCQSNPALMLISRQDGAVERNTAGVSVLDRITEQIDQYLTYPGNITSDLEFGQ